MPASEPPMDVEEAAAADGVPKEEPGAAATSPTTTMTARGGVAASGGLGFEKALARVVMLSSAGNVLEWMDFTVYAFLAENIGAAFFPPAGKEAQLIESFSVMAGAFVVRPLGGVVFGWIGDRRSKQFALQLSLFLMALSTTLIGCLPTYAQIGRAAPVLLTLLRMLQGLAVGGQLVGTMVFVHSHAPPGRGGFYGALCLSGAVFGVLLGAVVGTALHSSFSPEALQRYGFRIPFLCGFLVAFAGFAMHKLVPDVTVVEEETGPGSNPPSPRVLAEAAAASSSLAAALVQQEEEQEEQAAAEHADASSPVGRSSEGSGRRSSSSAASSSGGGAKSNPLTELMQGHKLELCFGTAALFLYCTAFYSCLVWLPTYLTSLVPHAPVSGAFPITTVNLALVCLLFPLGGHFGDVYGFYPVMLYGGLFLLLTSPLAFFILRLATPAAAFLGQIIFVLGVAMHGGPMVLFMTEHMTSSKHLYSAIALAYNLAHATFGGVASLISTTLAKVAYGYGAALWLSFIALVSCTALVVGYHPTRGLCTRGRGVKSGGTGGQARAVVAL